MTMIRCNVHAKRNVGLNQCLN